MAGEAGEMSAEVQELTHARLEPAIAGCPGLFAARTAGADVLDARYQLGDVELRMLAAHRPRPADLMTLAVLVALAGPGGHAPSDADEGLIGALEATAASASSPLVVRTTRARVLSECGIKDGGSARAALVESLTRLAGIIAIASRGSQRVSMHLLSFAIDEATGKLAAALSPRLTAAVLGGRHVRLELMELRALSEHARLLYVRLCAWVDPRSMRRVRLDVLMGYLWPEPPADAGAARDRRRLVRRAMQRLGELPGWCVEADQRGVQYTITRPVITPTLTVKTPTLTVKTPTPPGVFSE